MTAEEQDEQIRGFEERLRDLESRFCWEQERNRMLEERVTQLEMLLKKRKEYPVINHYLMQYAYKGKEEKLTEIKLLSLRSPELFGVSIDYFVGSGEPLSSCTKMVTQGLTIRCTQIRGEQWRN